MPTCVIYIVISGGNKGHDIGYDSLCNIDAIHNVSVQVGNFAITYFNAFRPWP